VCIHTCLNKVEICADIFPHSVALPSFASLSHSSLSLSADFDKGADAHAGDRLHVVSVPATRSCAEGCQD